MPLLLLLLLLVGVPCQPCPSPYKFSSTNNVCYYFHDTVASTCAGLDICASLHGHLPRPEEFHLLYRLALSVAIYVTGISDLVDERDKSYSGWRLVNGSVLPSNMLSWRLMEPNNFRDGEDCLALESVPLVYVLSDRACSNEFWVACFWDGSSNAVVAPQRRLIQTPVRFNGDSDEGCFVKTVVKSRPDCARMCLLSSPENPCLSFFWEEVNKSCFLTKHFPSPLARAENLAAKNWSFFK